MSNYPSLLSANLPDASPTGARKALAAYLDAGGVLEERGYAILFPADIYKGRSESPSPTTPPNRSYTTLCESGDLNEEDERPRTRAKTIASEVDSRLDAIERFLDAEEASSKLVRNMGPYRAKVIEQAAGDTFELHYKKGGEDVVLHVPTAPFQQWALWRTAGAHLAKPWKRVSPMGVKQFGDDPYHTDWIIGAGLEPEDWAGNAAVGDSLRDAAWDERFRVAQAALNSAGAVLSGTGVVRGRIVHIAKGGRLQDGEIGVIKNAGPDYVEAGQDAVTRGSALICETGGSMAHLVTVFREQDLRIMRVKDALTRFKVGANVTVDFDRGRVDIDDTRMGPSAADLGLEPEIEIEDDRR